VKSGIVSSATITKVAQATSNKQQATSNKQQATSNRNKKLRAKEIIKKNNIVRYIIKSQDVSTTTGEGKKK